MPTIDSSDPNGGEATPEGAAAAKSFRRRGLRLYADHTAATVALLTQSEAHAASARIAAHLGATLTGSRYVRVRNAEVELDRYVLTRLPA
jgi:hypothetical protein